MMKVEPRFKLDRSYKGPYRVTEVTATNGIVKPMNGPDKDTMIVPIQRLSKCHQPFPEDAIPWTGHSKSRRCRVIRGRHTALHDPIQLRKTVTPQAGRLRYHGITEQITLAVPEVQLIQEGEVVKDHERKRRESHVNTERPTMWPRTTVKTVYCNNYC